MAEGGDVVNENDPDWIHEHPPPKETDPKLHFQVGANAGKWLEYDDRGVPTKTIKKKKPTKKEKDGLEQEYLEARKKYQQYLSDVQDWENRKQEAENALEKTDRLRWAYRQIGEKLDPISVDKLDDVWKLMAWDQLTNRELGLLRNVAQEHSDAFRKLDLAALRAFCGAQMPSLLLEERLNSDVMLEIGPEDLYSPRSWRGILKERGSAEVGGRKSSKTRDSKKDRDSGSKSPRSGGGSKSPRTSKSRGGRTSPGSPRGEKEKKEKKSKGDEKSPSRNPDRNHSQAVEKKDSTKNSKGEKDTKEKKSKK